MIEKYIDTAKKKLLETALYSRTGVYLLESFPLLYLEGWAKTGKLQKPKELLSEETLATEVSSLINKDIENIKSGLYPISVLRLETPIKHGLNLFKIYKDAIFVYQNKKNNKSKVFSKEAAKKTKHLPDYYTRNFHNQTDGYLSEKSASMYDHQVEILFRGTAESMRRLILEPMLKHHKRNDKLKILDVGCGTGVSTFPLAKTFKKSRIKALDISKDYINFSKKQKFGFKNVHFQTGRAEDLKALDSSYDVWCSTFMFHELPKEIRKQALAEAFRVLKPGGHIYIVDSIQEHDREDFKPLIDNFPQNFHEPFYKNYSQTPLETLVYEAGFKSVNSEHRFMSKVCWATKP